MSTNTLATNIGRAVSYLKGIRDAITQKGVGVPAGTRTSYYEELIRAIDTGGGDVSPWLEAAIQTIYITNNGGNMDKSCSSFTKELVSCEGMWQNMNKLDYVYASFEKLTNGVDMFNNCLLKQASSNFNSLIDGTRMFANNYMNRFSTENGNMPELVNGDSMFYNNSQAEFFRVNMPKLENGNQMFYLNTFQSFTGKMPKLRNGQHMFEACASLTEFTAALTSLEDGNGMFEGCDGLTVTSLQNIITTLPDRSQTTNSTLTIGSVNISKLDSQYIDLAAAKNWTLN